jgi:DNA-binding PadR family transcriptional regulator
MGAVESFLPLQPAVLHILLALMDEDRHGYAIMQEVAARTNGKVKLSPGTLYGSIKRMLEDGFIEELRHRPAAGDDERRRYYRVTALGRKAAAADVARMADLVAQARAVGLRAREA